MEFKTELHCHTSVVSPCAVLTPEEVAEKYIAAGYSTVVVTDHFCDYVIDRAGATWEKKIDHYLSGYRRMKEYAGDRLNVLLGCELRFTETSGNDYLIFGITEQFLYDLPDVHYMTLSRFLPFARGEGFLIVQAHPLREGMKIVKTKFLDGIEVFNGSPTDARNDLADIYAKRYGLIRTSGSDYHGGKYAISGGIITDSPITSNSQLTAVLRSENYTLICEGAAAERDGMHNMPAAYDRKK